MILRRSRGGICYESKDAEEQQRDGMHFEFLKLGISDRSISMGRGVSISWEIPVPLYTSTLPDKLKFRDAFPRCDNRGHSLADVVTMSWRGLAMVSNISQVEVLPSINRLSDPDRQIQAAYS